MLSTSPVEPLTHWYQVRALASSGFCARPGVIRVNISALAQVRCLLRAPLAVGAGHVLSGTMLFEANEARGYNVRMTVVNVNTGVQHTNTVVTQCALHHFQYTTQSAQPAQACLYSQGTTLPPAATGVEAGGASLSPSQHAQQLG